ncbi:MAG: DNA replication/repair protein RecF [Clostridia bacterium]|nr:DNA replication/repair protein RecF [Clostridia bacterium]
MIVTRLTLKDFLSYPSEDVSFSDGIHVITGENAAGKTNLVESLYFASLGRSYRHNKDKELIRWDAEGGAKVSVSVQKKYSKHHIDIYVNPQGRKSILVDGLPLQKMGELMGVLNVVFFSPDEISLVKESPAYRRRFLDISLCQQSKTYFYTLQRYNKLLVQRNVMLKTNKGRPSLQDMLSLVDADFVRCASFIIQERAKFLAKLAPYAAMRHEMLTSGKETLRIHYETEEVHLENIAEDLKRRMQESLAKDCKLDYTTVGPHRDDIKIAANGVDIRNFGSQGQQRSAVLSLKLAEIELFKEKTGETPVLLLDDVLSELDDTRKDALFQSLDGIQTMVTCTELTRNLGKHYKKYTIKDRKVLTE